jgi:ribonucleoside-diphosphate reductase beta chain
VEDFFNGDIPSRLLIAFVSSQAYNGSYNHSPFNFRHYDLSDIGISVNDQCLPSKPLQPVYNQQTEDKVVVVYGNYSDAYETLLSGLDKLGNDHGLMFTRFEYPLGYCMYMFDLDASISVEGDFPLIRKGNLKLKCKFKKETPETINIIILGEFGSVFEVDQARNILQT